MASQMSFDPSVLGPFGNPFQMYFSAIDQMSQSMGPMKGYARCQLEMMGFMSRRAQAYMEIPSRLSQCRTPQDLMNEQMRFWQNAFQQYSDSSRKIMEAWAQAVVPPVGFGGRPAARERDYISFPDPKTANGQAGPVQHRERRVA